MRLVGKILSGVVVAALLVALAGYVWLRNSPHWAAVTLFAEDVRVENFRNLDRIFPSQPVASGNTVWRFAEDMRPLPATYEFLDETRQVDAFLTDTVTTGLLVLHDGVLVHEEYRLGADEASSFTSWSVAKSVLSILVGIALEEGHINSVHDQLTDYIPELAGSAYDGVTIEDALTMSSGVAFDEDYANPLSDVNRLFVSLSMGQTMVDILAGLGRDHAPGTYNNYISSDSIALGLVLEAATGIPNEEYLATRLWHPMGAEHAASWSTGADGLVLPFCCLNATLRDYARLGQLYLQGGARDGEQIVPRAWVEASTTPNAPRLLPGDNPASFWTFGYAYHWWIPENPQDEFMAIGIWGQYIYVNRARSVVIVKKSADYDFDVRDHETVEVFRAISAHFDMDPA